MLRKLTAIMLVLALVGIFGLSVGGCKDKSEEPATMQEYRQQAADTINESNAEAELAKIQKEIEADTE